VLLKTETECRRYVEGELDRAVRSIPGWRAPYTGGGFSPEPESAPPLFTWKIHKTDEDSWYTLQARLDTQEFVIWFGNHQAGSISLYWIVRPAVHVSFKDVWPREDPLPLRYCLGDVLAMMIRSIEGPRRFGFCFPMNSFSIT
jgi:hypothetical protein